MFMVSVFRPLARSWRIGLTAGATLIAVLLLSAPVVASRLTLPAAGYYTVWGQSSYVYTQSVVSYTAYGSDMDVWEHSGYVRLVSGSAVSCSRSRVFDSGWNAVYSGQQASSPYPITTYGTWYWDPYGFATVNEAYSVFGYYQVSSDYSGGQCAYGGGVGWEKPGQTTAWSTWPTSTQ